VYISYIGDIHGTGYGEHLSGSESDTEHSKGKIQPQRQIAGYRIRCHGVRRRHPGARTKARIRAENQEDREGRQIPQIQEH